MSMEGKKEQPTTGTEPEILEMETQMAVSDIARMIDAGEAYVAPTRDADGNVISTKVFKNDGTLLYFQDDKDMEKGNPMFRYRH